MTWPTASSAGTSPSRPTTRSRTPSWRSASRGATGTTRRCDEADEAIRCGPDVAFCHYVKEVAPSRVRSGWRRRRPPSEEAIRARPRTTPTIPPSWPPSPWIVAIGTWGAGAADRGLALDPEHANCLNLRAMALVQLGRKDEAARTLGSALADDPENALTHANQGWAYLHQGRSRPGPRAISARRSGSTPTWNGPRSGSSRR